MRSYNDINGDAHRLEITLGVRRRLKEVLNVDLLEAAANPAKLNELLTSIATDPEFLLKALAVIESCAASSAVTDLSSIMAELEAVFNATTIDDAATTLVEAIIDFFRSRVRYVGLFWISWRRLERTGAKWSRIWKPSCRKRRMVWTGTRRSRC